MLCSPLSISCLGTIGCTIDLGQPSPTNEPGSGSGTSQGTGSAAGLSCATSVVRSGTVAGKSIDFPQGDMDTTWFNSSLEELVLSPVDEEAMREVGLSPQDKEDIRRFVYFTRAYDFRWIIDEKSNELLRHAGDLAVYIFDLPGTKTPADAKVDVIDTSSVREARLSGDRKRLADTLRKLVDQMRTDNRPNAVIAFAPDRSGETLGQSILINLLGADVHYASSGSAQISNLLDASGKASSTTAYPIVNARSVNVTFDGVLDGSTVHAQATCLPLTISGP